MLLIVFSIFIINDIDLVFLIMKYLLELLEHVKLHLSCTLETFLVLAFQTFSYETLNYVLGKFDCMFVVVYVLSVRPMEALLLWMQLA